MLLVVVVSKFAIGAWVPVVLIPCIAFVLTRVKRHYDRVNTALRVPAGYRPRRHTHTVVVLVGTVHRATLAAVAYAKSLAPDRLVRLLRRQRRRRRPTPCRSSGPSSASTSRSASSSSPYRELSGPVLAELDELDAQFDNDIITVVLPEFVLTKWWEQLLHNQSALILKGRLLFRRNTVVVSVPYHIDHGSVDVPGVMEAPPRAPVAGSDPGS